MFSNLVVLCMAIYAILVAMIAGAILGFVLGLILDLQAFLWKQFKS